MKLSAHLTQNTTHLLMKTPVQIQAAAALLAMIACNFLFSWWAFLAPALIAGYLSRDLRRPRRKAKRVITVLGSLSWIGMAFIQDARSGWRISPRLSGLFQLHWGIGIYVILALTIGALTYLAASIGQKLRANAVASPRELF